MADHETAVLYDQDFHAWTQDQAARLRATRDAAQSGPAGRQDLPGLLHSLDWDNLVEEVEALGRSERRELGSRISLIIEHLAKLEFSPAAEPRPGWIATIGRERAAIDAILTDSLSLRRDVPEIVRYNCGRAVQLAARAMAAYGEIVAAVAPRLAAGYSAQQVLEDWWPPAK